MTTDPFTKAARAEAERRWSPRESDRLPMDWLDEGMGSGFVLGALWARTYLAEQEPTAAEVEAARLALHQALASDWMGIVNVLGGDQREYDALLAELARAALSAVRAARRDEETR